MLCHGVRRVPQVAAEWLRGGTSTSGGCLQPVCPQRPRDLRGFPLEHQWYLGWDFQEGQLEASQTKQKLLYGGPGLCHRPCSVLYRQGLILRWRLISKLWLGISERVEWQCLSSPLQFPPRQLCPGLIPEQHCQAPVDSHKPLRARADGSFIRQRRKY